MLTVISKPRLNPVWTRFLLEKLLKSHVPRTPAKAFLFAFVYVTLPRYLSLIYRAVRKRDPLGLWAALARTLQNALHPGKFPMFATKLVLGINLLEPVFGRLLRRRGNLGRAAPFVGALLASLASSLVTFPDYQHHIISKNRFYTLDMTLLLFVRATDTVLSTTLAPHTPAWLSNMSDVIFFNACTTVIMICWFFYPERLPPLYRDWITSAANMDESLVRALRQLHRGEIQYGQATPSGKEKVLVQPAIDCGLDPELGDLSVTMPIPCTLIHTNYSPSCEVNALWRGFRGLRFAISLYGPLNAFMFLLKLAMNRKNRSLKVMSTNIGRSVKSTIRSSAFLATFISLNWYGVCFIRSRLGPLVLTPYFGIDYTRFDSLYGVVCGSFLAGLSSIIELKQRQKELALFCAPKALGALLSPTKKLTPFDLENQTEAGSRARKAELEIESLIFSLSFAVLVAFGRHNPDMIRGIFGKGLKQVF